MRGSRVCRAASLRDSMAEEPCRSSTVAIKSRRLAWREGRRLVGEAYHTVLTADARDRAFFTARSVVMALSRTAISVQITLMDCAMCLAWLSGVFASLSISVDDLAAGLLEVGCMPRDHPVHKQHSINGALGRLVGGEEHEKLVGGG